MINQQTQPAIPVVQKKSSLRGHIVFWSVIIMACILFASVIYWQKSQPIIFGVAGQAANVTLSGYGASDAATKLVQQSQGYLYVMQQSQGNEVCEGNITAQNMTFHYLVRDIAAPPFGIPYIGQQICKQFINGTVFPQAVTPIPSGGSVQQPLQQTTPIVVKPNTAQPLQPVAIPNATKPAIYQPIPNYPLNSTTTLLLL